MNHYREAQKVRENILQRFEISNGTSEWIIFHFALALLVQCVVTFTHHSCQIFLLTGQNHLFWTQEQSFFLLCTYKQVVPPFISKSNYARILAILQSFHCLLNAWVMAILMLTLYNPWRQRWASEESNQNILRSNFYILINIHLWVKPDKSTGKLVFAIRLSNEKLYTDIRRCLHIT